MKLISAETGSHSKILVHAPNWLGDHAMAFAFYFSLREIFPQARLVLIGRSWVSDLLPAGVFDQVMVLSAKKMPAADFGALKQENFSLAFTLSPSLRSAWLLFRLGCQLRLGYKTDYRSWFLKYPPAQGALRIPPWSKYEHRSLSYLRLLTPFFAPGSLAENYWQKALSRPAFIDFSAAEKKEMARKFPPPQSYWVLAPGSVAPSKIYPQAHLVRVIQSLLAQKPKLKIVLAGSALEKPISQRLLQALSEPEKKRVFDFSGQTSLKELVFLLGRARGLLANDSGVAHLASLSQTPLVTFLGMGRKEETLTLAEPKIVLNLNLPCSPCMKQKCPRSDLACLQNISPDQVLAAIDRLDSSQA